MNDANPFVIRSQLDNGFVDGADEDAGGIDYLDFGPNLNETILEPFKESSAGSHSPR